MMNSELTGVIQFAITYLIQPLVNKRLGVRWRNWKQRLSHVYYEAYLYLRHISVRLLLSNI